MEPARIPLYPGFIRLTSSHITAAAQCCGPLPRLLQRQRCSVNSSRDFCRILTLCSRPRNYCSTSSYLATTPINKSNNSNNCHCIGSSIPPFRSQVCSSSLSNIIRNSRSACGDSDSSSSSSCRPFEKCNGSSNSSSNSRNSSHSSSSSALLLLSCELCSRVLSHVSGNASSVSTADLSPRATYAAALRAAVAACARPPAADTVSATAGAAASRRGEEFAATASRRRLVEPARAARYSSICSIYAKDFCFFSKPQQEEDVGRRGLCMILLAVCFAVVEKQKDDACSLTSSPRLHSHIGRCLLFHCLQQQLREQQQQAKQTRQQRFWCRETSQALLQQKRFSLRLNASASAAGDQGRRKAHVPGTAAAAFSTTTAAVAAPPDAWSQGRMRCICRILQRAEEAAAAAQGSNRRQQQELRYAASLREVFSRCHMRGSRVVRRKKKAKAGRRILLLEKRILRGDRNEGSLQKVNLLKPRCCTAAACAAGPEQPEAKRWRPLHEKSLQLLLQRQKDEEKLLQHQQEQRQQEHSQRQQQQQPRQHQSRQQEHQRSQRSSSWKRHKQQLILPPHQQQQHSIEEQTKADDSAPKRPQHALDNGDSVIRVMRQIAPCVVRIYRVSLGRRTAQHLLQSTAASHLCCGNGSRDFSSSSHTLADSSSSPTCAGSSRGSSLCASTPSLLASSSSSPTPRSNSSSSHSNDGKGVLAACCSSACTASNGNGSSGSGLALTERGRCSTASTRSSGTSDSLAAHRSGNSNPRIAASSNAHHQRESTVSNLRSSRHSEGRNVAAGAVAQYLGSGFIYCPRGLVVTAAHLFVEQQQQHPEAELAEAAANAAHPYMWPATTLEAAASAGPARAASEAAADTTVADVATGPLAVAAVPSASSPTAAAAAAACTVATAPGAARAADASAEVAAAAPPAAAAEAASWSYVVELADGRLLHATLKGRSSAADVAVLQLDLAPGEQLPAVSLPSFSNEQQLRPSQGELVIAYGAPQHADEPVGVVGRVSQSMQRFSCLPVSSPPVPFLQLGVLTLPGMSGSPVCNLQGQVVGMLAKKFHECGLALPIHFVANVASQLATTGVYRPPFLGLLLLSEEDKCTAVADFAAEAQRQLQQPAGSHSSSSCTSRRRNALVVDSVIEGSAAAAAGLRHGDVLTAVDGRPIGCLPELLDHLAAKHLDSVVGLRVLRGRDFFNCTTTFLDLLTHTVLECVRLLLVLDFSHSSPAVP